MYVIKRLYLNDYEIDPQFPNLKRFPKEEVLQRNVENPHSAVAYWRTKYPNSHVRYVIGKEK